MNQTKLESVIERSVDMFTGFIISVVTYNYFIIGSSIADSGTLVAGLFTAISFFRGLFWRRFFNAGLHNVVHKSVSKYYVFSPKKR